MTTKQAIQDVAIIARNGIDRPPIHHALLPGERNMTTHRNVHAPRLSLLALAIAYPPLAIGIAVLLSVAAVIVVVVLRRLLRGIRTTLKQALGDAPPGAA